MKAVILAAGVSKRLRPITNNKPKCLLKLNGETIIDYQLKSLFKFNINQILIVVGYKKDLIVNYIKQSKYKNLTKIIYNEIFDKTDNAYSLSLALEQVDPKKESVIILDGDIIFDLQLLNNLITCNYENALIADNTKKIEAEDCKLLIKEKFVRGIGKKIDGNTVYSSMIKLGGKFLNYFKKEIKNPKYNLKWYSEPLNKVLMKYPKEVWAIFTNKLLRCEIDTYEDLVYAREIYKKMKLL